MKKRELGILIVLAFINFTNILDFMIMMPLGPQFKRVFLMTPKMWSFVVSSYTFAAFVSGVISIFFIDKLDRKKMLLYSYFGLIIGTYLCSLAKTYDTLVAARIVAGVFGGLIGSTVLAITGDLIPLERRARAMGIIMMGFSASAALGVPLGIYFGTTYSWNMPFIAISIFSSFLLIFSFFIIPNIPLNIEKKKQNLIENLAKIFNEKNKNISLIFFSLLIFGQFLVIPFLSPFMVSNIGFKEIELVNIYLFGGVATIFTSPIIGKLSDRRGRIKMFIFLLILSVIPTYFITSLTSNNIYYIIFLSVLFFVLVGGRTIPAMALVLSTTEPEIRGTFLTIRTAFQQLVSGIASYVAGLIMIQKENGTYENYNIIGYISIFCCILTIPLVIKIKEKY